MRSVVSISLPEEVARELKEYARASGRNRSDIVRESIMSYLWEVRFRQLKRKLGAKAKKAGIVTEEDVFKVPS